MKDFDFAHYLKAKKIVDDRSLNRRVFDSLKSHLPSSDLRIIEAGGGIGTMVVRLLDWGVLKRGEYTLVENDSDLISKAKNYLRRWCEERGIEQNYLDSTNIFLEDEDIEIRLRLKNADIFDFTKSEKGKWNLLIANSFMDLVDLEETLDPLLSLLAEDGFFYLTLNFDGVTIFRPKIEGDEEIIRTYHEEMSSGPGDSQTGRKLLELSFESNVKIIDVGSSDWIVFPRYGKYVPEEKYFLRCILEMINQSISGRELDNILEKWLSERQREIANGELIFIAHQIDIAGVKRC